ncbi:MAG: STAS-like domain-containing protein [Armatimonadota bacterium]
MATSVKEFKLSSWGEFLGSRKLGAEVRRELEFALQRSRGISVDCEGVDTMSHSFADETFGKLALILGAEDFRHKVRFLHASPEVAAVVRYVLMSRLAEKKATRTSA